MREAVGGGRRRRVRGDRLSPRYYARGAMRLADGPALLQAPGERNTMRYEPRGVVAVISPWNFPLAIPAGMTAAALATGNAVVLKPAEQSPACGAALVQALHGRACLTARSPGCLAIRRRWRGASSATRGHAIAFTGLLAGGAGDRSGRRRDAGRPASRQARRRRDGRQELRHRRRRRRPRRGRAGDRRPRRSSTPARSARPPRACSPTRRSPAR